jgi:rRNA-processing protein FCF1
VYLHSELVLEVLNTLKTFQEQKKLILNVIQQQWDEHTYFGNCSKAFDTARKALNTQVSLLKRLYSISENKYVVIPDTNALLFNPELQEWSFELVRQFTIVLLPTVLSELDKLKMDHRSESVRQKAEKLIRQIKEYRRRGRLTKGVTLVRNRSEIIAIAVEPKFSESLSWLDAHNHDDRLLASCLEIMRQMPDAQVVLSTRDINLQNKAEFARIPFIELIASKSIVIYDMTWEALSPSPFTFTLSGLTCLG